MTHCVRCGGPAESEDMLEGKHRNASDCIAFLQQGITELEVLLFANDPQAFNAWRCRYPQLWVGR